MLVLVARGLSSAEIAQTLYVTLSTVKTHVSSLLLKLDACSEVHLVIAAYEADLVVRREEDHSSVRRAAYGEHVRGFRKL
ncbi:LuxR C-terminal-related transcriptional regulator [Nonomuraea fuscirosea]|nr:LuxR C-terminal-related transcriptional regulator [Nonomuraea fuscirosea]WSA56747.1 LuxR C-terminal-related transcriptional regulator [Nonomuraea fuscirosea]